MKKTMLLKNSVAALLILLAYSLSGSSCAMSSSDKENIAAVKSYYIRKITEPIVVDGKLDESVWSSAGVIGNFTRFLTGQGAVVYKTEVRMLWDKQNLYVAFVCEDPDIWSSLSRHDEPLWEGEAVEVYIDADRDGKNYKELIINPLNVVVDLNIPFVGPDANPGDWKKLRIWDTKELSSAVVVDGTLTNREDRDKSWTVEISIPFDNFPEAAHLPPHIGDKWRLQLYRIDRSSCLNEPEFSSWSPTHNFHVPGKFGVVIFSEKQVKRQKIDCYEFNR